MYDQTDRILTSVMQIAANEVLDLGTGQKVSTVE